MLRIIASKHDVLRMLAPKARPPFEEVWHLWTVLVPRRSITGRLLWGAVLRRRDDSRWIYKKYAEGVDAIDYPSRRGRSSEIPERPSHSGGPSRSRA
jgi:hypothetical protein